MQEHPEESHDDDNEKKVRELNTSFPCISSQRSSLTLSPLRPPFPPQKWTLVLVTCIVVNLATFSGVVFLAFNFKPDFINQHPEITSLFFAGAAGAIIACGIFLIIGEANHILGAAFTEEADATAVWGTAILAGMLCPYLFVALSPFNNLMAPNAAKDIESKNSAIEMTGTIGAEGDSSETLVATTAKKSQSLLLAICFGDFAHSKFLAGSRRSISR